MHVISQKPLRTFWEKHPSVKSALKAWFQWVKRCTWESLADVKQDFGDRVDQHRQFTIFDVGGNKCRLIAVINYQNQKVFVRRVLTHAEYDRDQWKEDAFEVKRFGKRGRKRP